MKEVFFNSRTIRLASDGEDVDQAVRNYANVVKGAVSHGYKKVRYDQGLDEIALSETESLKSYCGKHSRNPLCMLLLTTAKRPYIGDDEEEMLENNNNNCANRQNRRLSLEGRLFCFKEYVTCTTAW